MRKDFSTFATDSKTFVYSLSANNAMKKALNSFVERPICIQISCKAAL